MIRILLGVLLGAGIMYLVDSRYLSGRRHMLTDRFRRNSSDFSEKADEALQTSEKRARRTIDEARDAAHEWAEATRERASSVINGAPRR